jgi:hypothetical protein
MTNGNCDIVSFVGGPEIADRNLSLRAKRSNLSFFDEIATHPIGARDDRDSILLVAISGIVEAFD